ncbi:MAG: HDOD domain-containing protein, partial [Planctomycetota bacterium]|nr:HDOD domain-containing protein [Planctomycetota bacterium]
MGKKLTLEQIDKYESLPTLPAVVVRVLEVVLDSDSSAKDAAAIVASDPALAAKVLKVVNSPAYGLRQKVSTVGHAVAMLGFATLKGLVLSITVFDELLDKRIPIGLDKALYWQHSLAVGAAAKCLAIVSHYDLPEEAYVAGLLHDTGKVVMDFILKEEYGRTLDSIRQQNADPAAAELAMVGISHAEVGSRLLARWNLPQILQLAIKYHHEEPTKPDDIPDRALQLAAILHVADFACWAQGLGSVEASRPPALNPKAESRVKLDKRKTERVMEAVDTELKKLSDMFNLEAPDL